MHFIDSRMKKRLTIIISLLCFSLFLKSETPKTGLALSGGGARGLAHIGVLKVIDELDIQIDYISGTSMGAIIGGFYAAGYTALEIEDIVLNQFDWNFMQSETIPRKDYYIGEKRWANNYNFSLLLSDNFNISFPQGFISGNQFLNLFFDYFYEYSHVADFSQLPIPFACIATDLLTGETVILDSGSLHEAVRASMSIPSVFKPFELKGKLLIDGGIKMNLPSSLLWGMGADYVIGVQVSSELREKERLTNPIVILDQTINISTAESKAKAIADCSLVIEPKLEKLRAIDYQKAAEIIAAGEKEARRVLSQFTTLGQNGNSNNGSNTSENFLTGSKPPDSEKLQPLPENIIFNEITVEGNQHISSAKVREYTRLDTNTGLKKEDIIRGAKAAYNSDLFEKVYPVISESAEGFKLTLKVKEKPRNRLGISIRYNDRDDLILGGVLEMRNFLGNNSNLMLGMSIGGQREFLVDYVKNFGREFGVYFRLFPYVNEHTLYFYNDKQEKIASSNSLEYGAVFGIGAYTFNRYIIESFIYSYQKMLYRDIAEYFTDKDFFSSGIGLKFYHETLDDLVFPMKGKQMITKYTYASEDIFSDFSYHRFSGRSRYLLPILTYYSMDFQFDYGSFFDTDPVEFDPFYVGGFDSFLGMHSYEKSAPIVKIFTFINRFEIFENLFVDLQLNIANTGKYDLWDFNSATLSGGGLKIGYKSLLGPLRGGIGLNRDGNLLTYISIGYDYDFFEFSRR